MVFFTTIKPSSHYREWHEKEVPWDKVVEVILMTKNPRKKGNKYEIESDKYYVLFEIKNKCLCVINAKMR